MGGNSGQFLKERLLTVDTMPAGKEMCNAKRFSTDSYCHQHGVAPFARCKTHGGSNALVIDMFKKTLPFEQAAKLDILINDTLSMDNELASGKVLLLNELENHHRANYVLEQYMDNVPKRPDPDDDNFEHEMEMYKYDVQLHEAMMDQAQKMSASSYKRAQNLIVILSRGVAQNSKIKEGSKFQLDVRQISRLLQVQLEAHAVCRGCSKLKEVLDFIKEHTKDIPLNPHFSKKNREAIGRRQYNEFMTEVAARMPQDTEAEEIPEAEIADE
jgi:hypothetical protein